MDETTPVRISLIVTPTRLEEIRRAQSVDQVTEGTAVNQLLALGAAVHRAVREGGEIFVKRPGGEIMKMAIKQGV